MNLSRTIAISPAEAAARGLPALGIRMNLEGLHAFQGPGPTEGAYFSLSTPPGAPFTFVLEPLPEGAGTPAGLEAHVVKQNGSTHNFRLGEAGQVVFLGKPCPAQLWYCRESHAASALCSVASPELLLTFGGGGTPEQVRDLRTLAASFAELLSRLEVTS